VRATPWGIGNLPCSQCRTVRLDTFTRCGRLLAGQTEGLAQDAEFGVGHALGLGQFVAQVPQVGVQAVGGFQVFGVDSHPVIVRGFEFGGVFS
jgi:hypothetical protein